MVYLPIVYRFRLFVRNRWVRATSWSHILGDMSGRVFPLSLIPQLRML